MRPHLKKSWSLTIREWQSGERRANASWNVLRENIKTTISTGCVPTSPPSPMQLGNTQTDVVINLVSQLVVPTALLSEQTG